MIFFNNHCYHRTVYVKSNNTPDLPTTDMKELPVIIYSTTGIIYVIRRPNIILVITIVGLRMPCLWKRQKLHDEFSGCVIASHTEELGLGCKFNPSVMFQCSCYTTIVKLINPWNLSHHFCGQEWNLANILKQFKSHLTAVPLWMPFMRLDGKMWNSFWLCIVNKWRWLLLVHKLSLSKTTTLKYITEEMDVDYSSLQVDSQTKWVRLVWESEAASHCSKWTGWTPAMSVPLPWQYCNTVCNSA